MQAFPPRRSLTRHRAPPSPNPRGGNSPRTPQAIPLPHLLAAFRDPTIDSPQPTTRWLPKHIPRPRPCRPCTRASAAALRHRIANPQERNAWLPRSGRQSHRLRAENQGQGARTQPLPRPGAKVGLVLWAADSVSFIWARTRVGSCGGQRAKAGWSRAPRGKRWTQGRGRLGRRGT